MRTIRMIRGTVEVTAESVVRYLAELREATRAKESALEVLSDRQQVTGVLEAKSRNAHQELAEHIRLLLEARTPREARVQLDRLGAAAAEDRDRYETLRTHRRQIDILRTDLAVAERTESLINGELLFLADCVAQLAARPDDPLPLEVTETGFFRSDRETEEEREQLELREASARG